MNNLKRLMMVAGFALLAACGGEDTGKFVGEWVDPTPQEKVKGWGAVNDITNDISIKANGSSKVELTASVMGREKKSIYDVEGQNILDGKRVIYTLEGDELVRVGTGLKLVRK